MILILLPWLSINSMSQSMSMAICSAISTHFPNSSIGVQSSQFSSMHFPSAYPTPLPQVFFQQETPMSVISDGQSGEHTQQATLWKLALQFGQMISPYFQQPKVGLCLRHRCLALSKFIGSPNSHGQPTPLPYESGLKHSRPSSLNPAGQSSEQTQQALL